MARPIVVGNRDVFDREKRDLREPPIAAKTPCFVLACSVQSFAQKTAESIRPANQSNALLSLIGKKKKKKWAGTGAASSPGPEQAPAEKEKPPGKGMPPPTHQRAQPSRNRSYRTDTPLDHASRSVVSPLRTCSGKNSWKRLPRLGTSFVRQCDFRGRSFSTDNEHKTATRGEGSAHSTAKTSARRTANSLGPGEAATDHSADHHSDIRTGNRYAERRLPESCARRGVLAISVGRVLRSKAPDCAIAVSSPRGHRVTGTEILSFQG